MNAVDKWAWWQAALADFRSTGAISQPVHEAEPHIGFYRMREGGKKGPWIPVAIQSSPGGGLVAVVGPWSSGDRREATAVWVSCCRQPVTAEEWTAVAREGKPWSDSILNLVQKLPDPPAAPTEDGAPTIGHNSGEDPADVLATLSEAADELLADARKDRKTLGAPSLETWEKTDADRIQNKIGEIKALKSRVENAREGKTAPMYKAWKDEVARWKPLQDRIDQAVKYLSADVNEWLRAAQERERQEAAERARIERERLQAESERQEAERREMEGYTTAPTGQLLPPDPEPEPEPEVRVQRVMVGTAGTRAGLRVRKRHVIKDLKAAILFILESAPNNQDLLATTQVIVNRMRSAGVEVPGVETVEE